MEGYLDYRYQPGTIMCGNHRVALLLVRSCHGAVAGKR